MEKLLFTCACVVVRAGLGKHVWVTAPNSLYIINQAIFVQEIFYGIAQLSMKSSLIALLLRLFKPGGIALKLYITLGFLVTWFIVWVGLYERIDGFRD